MASVLSPFASLCMPLMDGYMDPVSFVHAPNWQDAVRDISMLGQHCVQMTMLHQYIHRHSVILALLYISGLRQYYIKPVQRMKRDIHVYLHLTSTDM